MLVPHFTAFRYGISQLRSVLREGLALLAVLTMLGGAANFGAQSLLALFLDPSDLGRFSNTLAQASLLVPLATLGLYGLWVLIAAEKGDKLASYVHGGLFFALLTSLFVYGCFAAWGWVQGAGGLYALIGTTIIGRASQELMAGSLQAEERYKAFAVSQFWPYAARLLIIVGCGLLLPVIPVDPLLLFSGAQAAFAGLLVLVCGVSLAAFRQRHRPTYRVMPHIGQMAREGWPFMAGPLIFVAYTNAGIIITAEFIGFRQGGHYALASALATGGFMISSTVYQRHFQPRMFRWRVEAPTTFAAFFYRGYWGSAVLAGLLALLFLLCSQLMVPIFGVEYRGSAPLVMVFGVVVAMRCLTGHSSTLLVSSADIAFRVRSQLCCFVIMLPLMMAGAVYLGAVGVVGAALLYEGALAALYFPRARAAARESLAKVQS